MNVVSVNVSLPRAVTYRGRTIHTGIFKEPVQGPVRVARHNLEGDGQADLTAHGGPEKAVYAYPSEHYPYWAPRLGHSSAGDLAWGTFGENLTTSGLGETEVLIGDRYRIGTALFRVTQPRRPCYKLAMKLDRDDMVRMFEANGRSGFYLAVAEEGEVAAGAGIERVARSPFGVSVADVNRLFAEPDNVDLLGRVLEVPDLAEAHRKHFEKRLRRLG